MPDQYYQVAMNNSWRWAKVDFFVNHAHHPWSSLLYSTTVLYDSAMTMSLAYFVNVRNNVKWKPTNMDG